MCTAKMGNELLAIVEVASRLGSRCTTTSWWERGHATFKGLKLISSSIFLVQETEFWRRYPVLRRSFVCRSNPKQHRLIEGHRQEVDPYGKLCRHRANQTRAAGSICITNAIEDLRREPRRHGDRRKTHLSQQRPRLMRAAIDVRLDRRLDEGGWHISRGVGHGVEIERRHALHDRLLDSSPVGIPIPHVERGGLFGILQNGFHTSEPSGAPARVGATR